MLNFTNEIVKSLADTGLIDAAEAEALLVTPPKDDMGDYALPCFTLAKRLRKAPAAIAAEIAEKVSPSPLVERVEATGPYLNFFVNRTEFLRQCFTAISADDAAFGLGDYGRGKTIVIDYSSPNIAKEFRVFHLRTTVLGHALYNIFGALGYKVVGINHLGDWGTQFGVVIAAFKEKGDRAALDREPLKYLTQLYVDYNRRMAEDDSMRETARGWLKKLEDGDAEAHELWKLFCDLSIKDFKRAYARLGIEFDHYLGESFYFKFTDEIIKKAHADGIAVESQGATVIEMDEENVPPVILRKSDGATGYHTRDIAAAIWRHDEFDFDRMLYVVGAEQKLHFRQLIEALTKLNCDWAGRLEHVAHGLYLETREVDGVQVRAKAGTRSGFKVILADIIDDAVARAGAVIDENYPDGFPGDKTQAAEAIGIGAIVFGDLKNAASRTWSSTGRRCSISRASRGRTCNTPTRVCAVFWKNTTARSAARSISRCSTTPKSSAWRGWRRICRECCCGRPRPASRRSCARISSRWRGRSTSITPTSRATRSSTPPTRRGRRRGC